ncbi:hypothetical protein Hamer_G026789, partial [Homarus americanus]
MSDLTHPVPTMEQDSGLRRRDVLTREQSTVAGLNKKPKILDSSFHTIMSGCWISHCYLRCEVKN